MVGWYGLYLIKNCLISIVIKYVIFFLRDAKARLVQKRSWKSNKNHISITKEIYVVGIMIKMQTEVWNLRSNHANHL